MQRLLSSLVCLSLTACAGNKIVDRELWKSPAVRGQTADWAITAGFITAGLAEEGNPLFKTVNNSNIALGIFLPVKLLGAAYAVHYGDPANCQKALMTSTVFGYGAFFYNVGTIALGVPISNEPVTAGLIGAATGLAATKITYELSKDRWNEESWHRCFDKESRRLNFALMTVPVEYTAKRTAIQKAGRPNDLTPLVGSIEYAGEKLVLFTTELTPMELKDFFDGTGVKVVGMETSVGDVLMPADPNLVARFIPKGSARKLAGVGGEYIGKYDRNALDTGRFWKSWSKVND